MPKFEMPPAPKMPEMPPPPPPPPEQQNMGANDAANQQREAAARRQGVRRSILAGDTGGYNPVTGSGALGQRSILG